MTASGHDRSFGDVGSMSGLPESGHEWAENTQISGNKPSLRPATEKAAPPKAFR